MSSASTFQQFTAKQRNARAFSGERSFWIFLKWEVILNLPQVILNLISEVASSWQNSFFATALLMCFPPPWYCPFVLHNFCHNFPEIVQNSRQRIWNFAKPEFKCIRCILSTDLDYHLGLCFLIVYRNLSDSFAYTKGPLYFVHTIDTQTGSHQS